MLPAIIYFWVTPDGDFINPTGGIAVGHRQHITNFSPNKHKKHIRIESQKKH